MVYPALLPLMRTPRLPVVKWTDPPADLNGFIRFAKRQNLVSACVPSHFKHSLPHILAQKLLHSSASRYGQRGTARRSQQRSNSWLSKWNTICWDHMVLSYLTVCTIMLMMLNALILMENILLCETISRIFQKKTFYTCVTQEMHRIRQTTCLGLFTSSHLQLWPT
jgi:hypothetical protein